jgi:hypothetical protein
MGQASGAKMTSPGGKLTALICHPTKKVNKAEKLTYLSTNIRLEIAHTFLQNLLVCFDKMAFGDTASWINNLAPY